ncbi:MAG: electron transfer flavoprotein subunit alpha/FixB family protein [Myxococcales bacterium]|nr:electron transfer flavoprotein subunit alpha/FixB family protein [Myxococcales bacterium]MDH5567534.1 electron transfer flavoprotein subunit alpha/FixB family protein [Myxococcales bacterium]
MSAASALCVYSERAEVGLELLSAAGALARAAAPEVVAIARSGDAEFAAQAIARGADRVCLGDGAQGAPPRADDDVAMLAERVRAIDPGVLLIGATVHGTEVAGRLAQRLGVACATDCLQLRCEAGHVIVQRRWCGRFIATQRFETRPAIATLAPGRFEAPAPDADRTGAIEAFAVQGVASRIARLDERPRRVAGGRIDRAEVIVAAGRGVQKREDLALVEALARVLGASLGASRPLTDDLQWLPADVKIGLSGRTVKPRLYIACGISGQIEHVVGIRDAGVVVAINRDANAPIFEEADFRVIGDLYEEIPALTAAFAALR